MPTGALGYVKYGYETTFGGGTPAPARSFGIGTKLSTSEKRNNIKPIYGLGAGDAAAIVDGIYEGRLSLDFEVSNMWFLPAIMGMKAGSATGADDPYTWSPSWTNALPSMVIENGLELGATDYVQTFKGVVAESLNLTGEVGNNPIHAKLDCVYQTEAFSTTAGTVGTDTQSAVFNFAQSKLEMPAATNIGNVERFSLTIKRNPKLIYGLGSRLATTSVAGIREYDVEFNALVADGSLLKQFFDGSTGTSPATGSITEIASLLIGFSNDGWSAAAKGSKRFTFQFDHCKIESYSPPMEVENAVMQALSIKARECAITVINDEGTKPADVTA